MKLDSAFFTVLVTSPNGTNIGIDFLARVNNSDALDTLKFF